jgi:hypothetical protein
VSEVLCGGGVDGCKVAGVEEGVEPRVHRVKRMVKIPTNDKEMEGWIVAGDEVLNVCKNCGSKRGGWTCVGGQVGADNVEGAMMCHGERDLDVISV